MTIVRTSTKGQIVIPKHLRKKLGLQAGQRINIRIVGEKKLELLPVPEDPITAYCGIFKKGKSLTKALLEERRQDNERE